MGCCAAGQKIEIVYCESCGWFKVAKKVVQEVRRKHPSAEVDCHPADGYTGLLQVYRFSGKEKRLVFSGDKQTALKDLQSIVRKLQG